MALSFNINKKRVCFYYLLLYIFYFKTKLCFVVSDRQEKHAFIQNNFCLQGILISLTKRNPSFPYCKLKHMMKNEATPDKFRVLFHSLPTEFYGLNSQGDF